MKKHISVILAILIVACLMAGCGASSAKMDTGYGGATKSENAASDWDVPAEAPAMEEPSAPAETGDSALIGASGASKQVSLAEKIIYSADAQIETVDFDTSVSDVYKMVEKFGAFLERSYVSGANYDAEFYGYQTYRNAEFVVRVPVESFEGFKGGLDTLGNVTSVSTSADNITSQYYDVQSRLTAYQTEEKTLIAMLEKAETVSDMIEVESKLAEVRYEIESLQSTLKNWDNQVDYSTVVIYLSEVRELTEQVAVQRTYWEEIGDGFASSLKSVGRFFTDLLKWFVSNLPVLGLVAVIAAAAVLALKAIFKGNPEKRAARMARKAEKKAAKAAVKAAKAQRNQNAGDNKPDDDKKEV